MAKKNANDGGATGGIDPQLAAQFQQFLAQQSQAAQPAQPQPTQPQLSAEQASQKALELGLKEVRVYVNGPGAGRESAIRAIQAAGLAVSLIKDVTRVPHNGCRPPTRRRV